MKGKKAETMVPEETGSVILSLVGILLVLAILIPLLLRMCTTDKLEPAMQGSMQRLGDQTNGVLAKLDSIETAQAVFPFQMLDKYIVIAYKQNSDGSIKFCKAEACICVSPKDNPDKKYNCQTFKDADISSEQMVLPSKNNLYNIIVTGERTGNTKILSYAYYGETSPDIVNAGEQSSEVVDTESQAVLDCTGDFEVVTNSDGTKFSLRKSAADRFKAAQDAAKKEGKDLTITSAYRTYDEQLRLWNFYGQNPSRVCNPGTKENPNLKCPHMTGCAIDVDICVSSMCIARGDSPLYSSPETDDLQKIMHDAGFVRYAKEWWHFEYGTDRWARANAEGKEAIV